MKEPIPLKAIEEEIVKISSVGRELQRSVFARFPVLFSLLTTFGLVATLYGFEKVIDKISIVNQHPELLLLFGLSILAGTGTLYKKLR